MAARRTSDAAKLQRILASVDELRLVRDGLLARMTCTGPDGEEHAVRFNPERWSLALDAMLKSLDRAAKRKAGRASGNARRRAKWGPPDRMAGGG